ncbi:hypothetical protein DPX16_1390 [Anabarilius grahami]|uniref:Uncharacterized protein n=1 Tax=Anabarilius grahami TaxID=495550 RepID=A0A3N0XZS8_ANAGA|nr:hypothetical protein DPX16_1390 [Anabarilius grahami]
MTHLDVQGHAEKMWNSRPNDVKRQVLEERCKTVEDLEELCDQLKDADFRKKMIRYLSSGSSLADGIRRMLKKLEIISYGDAIVTKGERENFHFSSFL